MNEEPRLGAPMQPHRRSRGVKADVSRVDAPPVRGAPDGVRRGTGGVVKTSQSAFGRYVALGLLSIAAYFLLPQLVQNVALLTSNLVATAVILICCRRRRLGPSSGWRLLAGFTLATGVGNGLYFVNDSLRHVQPFPSVGDAAFLGGYLLLAAGLLRLQRARTARIDVPAVLDTAIITVGFAAASWVVLMAPLLHDGTVPLLHRLTALGYPVADVLVLAVAARFFLTSRRRAPAFTWLAGIVIVMLVADTSFAVLNLLGLYQTGHPVDALILAYNLGWGAVALHPGAGELTTTGPPATARPSWPRLTALTVASLIAPTVLVAQVTTGHLEDVVVTASASALLFVLVVGRMAGLVRTLEQVLDQRHALEQELEHRASHDDLTGLANRRLFTDTVQRSLDTRPNGGTQVLFLDLDRFKTVNDSLGHTAGDTLLTITANRLRAASQPGDVIARLGGDEFAVLLDERTPRTLDDACARLTRALAVPVPLHGLDLHVTASIGAAQAHPGEALEHLVHRADIDMYENKARRHAPITATLHVQDPV
jgi:diguanylate cyclase (GGDEF)-like protein